VIEGLQLKNDLIITKEKLCLPAATVEGVWGFGGWGACCQLVTFVHDRVRVCGKHFTCCTDGSHMCVRSCLQTTQHYVKAYSEGSI